MGQPKSGYCHHRLDPVRKQRDEGALHALGRRRGHKRGHPSESEAEKLRKRAEPELKKARKVTEVQGNVTSSAPVTGWGTSVENGLGPGAEPVTSDAGGDRTARYPRH
ncbi:MAG: hypothetical protein U5R14_06110 [Gemmatimonadota bacterium]|nr:hypothetical protein [Gemmatimonadota bacterium]